MTERILATGLAKERIIAALQYYRDHDADYIKELHPDTTFVSLAELITNNHYASLIHQSLFRRATELLAQRLESYGSYNLLDPARVWVGISMPQNDDSFGGFYHHDQGYRYLQQIAVVSLSGSLLGHPVDRTLATLELVRGYAHDTLHYNSYRPFAPLKQPGDSIFYRLQYGINFRRKDGHTYSKKDSVKCATTRNLGTIMEAATDRFAHDVALSLVQESGYNPPSTQYRDICAGALHDPINDYIYRDCTGQLTLLDIDHLRDFERGEQDISVIPNFKRYLKSMRLFVQYVNLRYAQFLSEFDQSNQSYLHHLILHSMLSGKMKDLCDFLDSLHSLKRSFVHMFKDISF